MPQSDQSPVDGAGRLIAVLADSSRAAAQLAAQQEYLQLIQAEGPDSENHLYPHHL